MARSGKKTILLDVSTPKDIEQFINLANKKGQGLTLSYKFTPGRGLEISMAGPRDRILFLERLLRDAWREYLEPNA